MYTDPEPKKITLDEWSMQFRNIDTKTIGKFIYYDNHDWGIYLQPPATFMLYGARELKRLRLDNSLAALRMWGFVFNESERLFRARQNRKKVIATMGDLGTVSIIVMAFPNCIPFYPECIWWTPFFNESTVLLDMASELGAPEAACFSRAALAAFFKKAYFPKPDYIFASTGATCDDYSCIMQSIEHLGYDFMWLEAPVRRSPARYDTMNSYVTTKSGSRYARRFEEYLIHDYKRVWQKMVELTGIDDMDLLTASITKANRVRNLVEKIKRTTNQAKSAPFPALELMTVEFGNLYGYADMDEWIRILEMIHDTIERRVQEKKGIMTEDAIPIAWVNPTADPYLLDYVEDLGLRVVDTEYVINQAIVGIDEQMEPFRALAQSFMQASLIGSTAQRISPISKAIKTGKIEGILITNMLGGSHCAMETKLMERLLKDKPVLAIDVPAPFGITEQIKTRLQAFAEVLHERRK